MLNIQISKENKGAINQVWNLNCRAFGREDEANLINLLRGAGIHYISLVSKKNNDILGHIFFSPVELINCRSSLKIMGLGPMAVIPEFQKMGIGSNLIKAGLEECINTGYDSVVVLGHPEYYPKFGFEPAVYYGIESEYDVPQDAFMILELKAGVLNGVHGKIKYHEAFGSV